MFQLPSQPLSLSNDPMQNGKGVVIAKYPVQAAFGAASETPSKVFAEMIEAGIVEKDSVHPHAGEVFNSF